LIEHDAATAVSLDGRVAPTIVLDHVSKWYGEKVALSDVTFSIGPGVTALLGPNGAGKSTALKLLTGQLRPSGGTVSVLGQPAVGNIGLYRRIGLVPEQESVYGFLTLREFVELAARLQGLPDVRGATERAIQHVGLQDSADRPVEQFSKGMRQRAKIAQALVHEPEVLILDEPLTGADPRQRVELIDLFDRMAANGATVLVSSHVLSEVERMGSNVLVLVDGKLAAEGDFRRIRDLMNDRPRRMRVRCERPRDVAAKLLLQSGTIEVRVEDDGLELETADLRGFAVSVPRAAREASARLFAIESLDESLESVFRYLVE
jgi:ABC-2 type transport system ATP-binding protein